MSAEHSQPKEVEMDYNLSAELQVTPPAEAYLYDLGSFYDRVDLLVDQRDARGKRYTLALIITLVVLAKMSGEDNPYAIADWAQQRCESLVNAFHLERATMPCHNTYRRVMAAALEPTAMQMTVTEFLTSHSTAGLSVLISLDGKTLRGTIAKGSLHGLHLLAAYLPGEGLVLMQVAVDCQENEISAAPRVLRCLDLRGKIVMGDALHTQRELSLQILKAGGDYLWYAKDNQQTLHRDIEHHFQPEICGPGSRPLSTDFQNCAQTDIGHGRIEVRTLTTSRMLQGYLDWPGVAQVFKLERRVMDLHLNPVRQQVVYGLTSLTADEADPLRLIALTRSYWGIENGLHYRRDVTLHEDAIHMRDRQQAEAMAILNNLVIGLAVQQGFNNLAAARRYYAAHQSDALELLFRQRN
jgi:predicted transposase YbfD/YdcC